MNRKRPSINSLRNDRGMTLIELMVVVAIIGILAGIGGVVYSKYLKKGKIARLKQYAMEVKKGQEQFKARNGTYLDINDPYWTSTSSSRQKWEELLEFVHPQLQSSTIKVRTDAGGPNDSCDSKVCPSGSTPSGSGRAWYAINVSQDLNAAESTNTTIYLDSTMESTLLLHEGD